MDVFNTTSWRRTDLVMLPKETSGDLVKDERGQPVASQRLSTGELVFLAGNVPPFGTKRFTIAIGKPAVGARLNWNRPVSATWLSSAREEQSQKAPDAIPLAKHAMVTLRGEP